MKTPLPFPGRLSLACLILAFPASAADLTTLDGKVYQEYEVTKVEPDGLSIRHAAGTAKIPFHRLPEEMQKEHRYDPFNAYDYDKEEARKRREAEADKEATAREQREALARQVKGEAFAKALDAAAKRVQLKPDKQSLEITNGIAGPHELIRRTAEGGAVKRGVYCMLLIGKIGMVPVMKGKLKTGETKAWVFPGGGPEAYLDIAPLVASGEIMLQPDGTGRIKKCEYEGVVWRTGCIEFTDLDGTSRTAGCYTTSRGEAAAFYKKHGFPEKSGNLVADWQGVVKR